jgi:outer membrane lipoprotein-sorting protein
MKIILKLSLFLLLFAMISTLYGSDAETTKLFDRYKGVKTFSADFNRVFTAKMTKKITKDGGTIRYLAPEFISIVTMDKTKVVEETYITPKQTSFVDHLKKSVLIKTGASGMGDYLVFLRGPEAIKKSFTVKNSTASIEKANKAGLVVEKGSLFIKLTPKQVMADLRYMFLIAKNNEVVGIIIVDQLKNINQFFFSNISYKKKLQKKQFMPKTPKGYEVSYFQ